MTIKEMRNKINEIGWEIGNKYGMNIKLKAYKLQTEILINGGYSKKYCRLYLQNNARKEQVKDYLESWLIVVDMLDLNLNCLK